MILRRLSQSLREQNWTAIVIEFVLLVVGVFLGIQVGNWNQERELRNKSAVFTARLRDDMAYERWSLQVQISYYASVQKYAEMALGDLYGQRPLGDEQFVISAYRASQYLFLDRARATYDELVSTGTIGLIEDVTLRRSAMTAFTTVLYDSVSKKAQESEYRQLFRESMSYEVQNALMKRCGDHRSRALDYDAISRILDYECSLDLPPESIAKAAAALKAQARLVPSLQLRQADLATALSDLRADQARRGLAR